MRKEILILSSVALGSMAVGFLVVLLVMGPGESRTLPDPFAGGGTGDAEQGPPPSPPAGRAGKEKPAGPSGAADRPAKEKPAGPSGAADRPAKEPEAAEPAAASSGGPAAGLPSPGKIALAVGEPFIWRCWAEGQSEPLEKGRCGSLAGVAKLVSDNLGVIEGCVIDHAGPKASGKLSLALKLDFSAGKVKAWLGNSTTVAEMESISACLRSGFDGKAPPSIAHDYPRYIVFFTIEVG